MAQSVSSIARKAALGMAAAAAMTTAASAASFTQAECKGIRATAAEVVRTVGKNTLSMEFRQSFVNWMGADLRCDGPKDIVIVTHNDDAALATIRDALLTGSKPISLHKAGLRILVREKASAAAASPQKRSDATPTPAVN